MPPKNPFEKSYSVALYQSMRDGTVSLYTYYGKDDAQYHLSANTRISEPVEVRFTPLPREEFAVTAVAALDAEVHRVVTEHLKKLAELKELRANLLALGCDTVPDPIPAPPPCVSDHGATAAPF